MVYGRPWPRLRGAGTRRGGRGRMGTVAVVGSGAAGLAAALAARKAGAQVTVYERADRVGGTTALSGGNAWLPANRFLDDDSPEQALPYPRAVGIGRVDHDP